jgi:hypothetical protein
MKDLQRYLELIVDPTFDDFTRNRQSVRHCFLACLATFHAIDRAASLVKINRANLRREWRKKSLEFQLVDIIAHHLKHMESDYGKGTIRGKIPIEYALGIGKEGDTLDVRNLYFVIRDAIRFVRQQTGLAREDSADYQTPL